MLLVGRIQGIPESDPRGLLSLRWNQKPNLQAGDRSDVPSPGLLCFAFVGRFQSNKEAVPLSACSVKLRED